LEKTKIIFKKNSELQQAVSHINQEIWVQKSHTVVKKLLFVGWGIFI